MNTQPLQIDQSHCKLTGYRARHDPLTGGVF